MTSPPPSPTRPHPDQLAGSARPPWLALVLAVVATAAVVAAATLAVHGAFHLVDRDLPRQAAFAEQTARVTHLDEVLTTSARLYAATGDERWRERYDAHVGPLDEAIAAVRDLAPGLFDRALGAETDEANQALIAMELEAMDLAAAGRREEALARLRSPEYERQMRRYAEGNAAAKDAVEQAVLARAEAQERSFARMLVVAQLSGLVMVIAWISVVSSVRRYVAVQREGIRAATEAHAARAASDAKSLFLANMSHEIRTPMTAILGFADLLGGDLADDPEAARDAVATIRSNARHLLAILNDILDVSKIEAGQLAVERMEMSPSDAVEEVVSLSRAKAIERGIDLTVAYDTPIPERVLSDPTRLRQIVLNLVGNAVKFTSEGGVTVHVACEPREERLVIRVVDTGIGMSPEQVERVARFDAFAQADGTITRRYGGTGLGLHVSHSLAGMLGGGIEVASVPDEGSTFTVRVATGPLDDVAMVEPAAAAAAEAVEAAEAAERSAGSAESAASTTAAPRSEAAAERPADATPGGGALDGVHVLLVEDGPDNHRLVAFHLRRAGAEVTVRENGRQAVELFEGVGEAARPDLVLMDMQMPVMDGYEATRRLREMGVRLPIVALTAHAMEGDERRCLEAGCDDYACKPIDRAGLIELCRKWADRGAGAGAGAGAAAAPRPAPEIRGGARRAA